MSAPPRQRWPTDDGNDTFANPVVYAEFSDPDLIRARCRLVLRV